MVILDDVSLPELIDMILNLKQNKGKKNSYIRFLSEIKDRALKDKEFMKDIDLAMTITSPSPYPTVEMIDRNLRTGGYSLKAYLESRGITCGKRGGKK